MDMKTSPSSSSFLISLREKWLTRDGQMGKEGKLVRREQSERFVEEGALVASRRLVSFVFCIK